LHGQTGLLPLVGEIVAFEQPFVQPRGGVAVLLGNGDQKGAFALAEKKNFLKMTFYFVTKMAKIN
jgi:hypothetical protein